MHGFYCIFTKNHDNSVTLINNNRLICHFVILINTTNKLSYLYLNIKIYEEINIYFIFQLFFCINIRTNIYKS